MGWTRYSFSCTDLAYVLKNSRQKLGKILNGENSRIPFRWWDFCSQNLSVFTFFLYEVKSWMKFCKICILQKPPPKTAWVHIAKKMRVRKQNPFHLEISQKERLIEQLDALSDTFFRSCLCLALLSSIRDKPYSWTYPLKDHLVLWSFIADESHSRT